MSISKIHTTTFEESLTLKHEKDLKLNDFNLFVYYNTEMYQIKI